MLKPNEILKRFNKWADELLKDLCLSARFFDPEYKANIKGQIRSIKSAKIELERIIKEGK